jgi:arsenite methyltransferase
MQEIDATSIREAVRKKYVEVAQSAEGKFAYPTGRPGALALGYDASTIESLPDDVLASFCGVGNPFALGPIRGGEAVLDVGCGAGFDMIVASRLVGSGGKVCGIDMTPEMAERARANLQRSGVTSPDYSRTICREPNGSCHRGPLPRGSGPRCHPFDQVVGVHE